MTLNGVCQLYCSLRKNSVRDPDSFYMEQVTEDEAHCLGTPSREWTQSPAYDNGKQKAVDEKIQVPTR